MILNPIPLLTKAMEIGGARLFLVVASVLIFGAFVFAVGRGMLLYFASRTQKEQSYLDEKTRREEEVTKRLLDMIQKSMEKQEASSDRQNTVNAKSIEALNSLLKLGEAANSKLETVDDKLTDALGWMRGRAG